MPRLTEANHFLRLPAQAIVTAEAIAQQREELWRHRYPRSRSRESVPANVSQVAGPNSMKSSKDRNRSTHSRSPGNSGNAPRASYLMRMSELSMPCSNRQFAYGRLPYHWAKDLAHSALIPALRTTLVHFSRSALM